MKNFTTREQFEKAPLVIQHIYMCRMYRIPIGSSLYFDAKRDYPEYFKDDVEKTEPIINQYESKRNQAK